MATESSHKDLFFIVGRGRSGTDLLQRLLNTHEQIHLPPEASFIPLLYKKYVHKKQWKKTDLRAFAHDVCLDDKIKEWWKLSEEKIYQALLNANANSFRKAVLAVYQLHAERNGGGTLLGDKNPANSLYVGEILKVFPEARFIYLTRDPVDNVNSFKNVDFDSDDSLVLAHRWRYYNEELLRHQEDNKGKFLRLTFESLVSDTEHTLAKIAAFLHIENRFDLEKKQGGDKAWQKNLGGNVSTAHVGKGHANLSEEEIGEINNVCAPIAEKLGYETNTSGKPKSSLNAGLLNYFERNYIRLPLFLSTFILRLYRKKKKIIRED